MTLFNALKGLGGEYEVQRVLGAFGTVTYIISGPALIWSGKITASFDSFCISYAGGLAACIGATAGSIALKDRNVAAARVVEATGCNTATPSAPASDNKI